MSTTNYHIHADLVDACKEGDPKAQYRLYQLYSRAMFNICLRMLGDRAAAEDALQEAFVNAFRKLDSFEARASFGAWLKRIVVNKCLSQLNKSKIFTEPLDERTMEEPDSDTSTGEAIILNPGKLHAAINSLPNGCRVIFSLYQLEGYDHQEISEILGVSVSTSKSQFHRAKKLLKQRLKKEAILE